MLQLGLEKGELSQIRINLMEHAEVADLLARKRPARPSVVRASKSITRRSVSGSKRAPPPAVLSPSRPETILEPRHVGPRCCRAALQPPVSCAGAPAEPAVQAH